MKINSPVLSPREKPFITGMTLPAVYILLIEFK